MTLDECTNAIRTKVGSDSGLNASLKFDCGDDGIVYIDGKSTPNSVSNDNGEADCTVGITLENLTAMLEGDLDPATGFMMGKLKVSGDMSVALRLQRVI
ncbi:MAG: SCP2 sterol-binding domain-containing protein [Burkholderiaceae bacterium]|jgi:putative sterol carrier protein